MSDNRRLQLVATHAIAAADLPLAAEIWLGDLKNELWVSAEAIKLSVLFLRHMADPDKHRLNVGRIEGSCRIDAQQLSDELRKMQTFGVVHEYTIDGEAISVSLNFSLLQYLKLLETRERLGALLAQSNAGNPRISPEEEAKWMPKARVSRDPEVAIDVADLF